jgi:hypothetical protein
MTEPPSDPRRDRPLNRSLKQERDTSHNLDRSPGPLETTEARESDGKVWPIVWAVVVILCIATTLYLIF